MFRPDDVIEATEARETEIGPIRVGDRHTVQQVSVSGAFVRVYGAEPFVRADGFKLAERPTDPGAAAALAGDPGLAKAYRAHILGQAA